MDDLCFLTEKDALWSGLLADVLEQNKVPYLTRPRLGAGAALKIGPHAETTLFYVPKSELDRAKDLLAGLFGEADPAQNSGNNNKEA